MPVDIWLMGFDAGDERVVPALMKVFGIDETRAAALIEQLPRIVKRNADFDVGEQYAAALRSIGGTVEVRDALGGDLSERIPVPNSEAVFAAARARNKPGVSVAAPSNSTLAAPHAEPFGGPPLMDGADAPTDRAEAIELPESQRFDAAALGAPLVPSERTEAAPIAPTIATTDVGAFDAGFGAGFDSAPAATVPDRPSPVVPDTDYDSDLVAGVPTARQPAGQILPAQPEPQSSPAIARPRPAPRPAMSGGTAATGSTSTGWIVFAALMLVGLGSAAYGIGRTTIVDEQFQAMGPSQAVLQEADLGMTMEVDECLRAASCTPINDLFDKADFHAFVEDLYNAGATEVMFANLTADQGARVSSWLVVRMPGDVATRSAVISVFNDWMETDIRDHGQTFIDADLAAAY